VGYLGVEEGGEVDNTGRMPVPRVWEPERMNRGWKGAPQNEFGEGVAQAINCWAKYGLGRRVRRGVKLLCQTAAGSRYVVEAMIGLVSAEILIYKGFGRALLAGGVFLTRSFSLTFGVINSNVKCRLEYNLRQERFWFGTQGCILW